MDVVEKPIRDNVLDIINDACNKVEAIRLYKIYSKLAPEQQATIDVMFDMFDETA